MVTMITIMRYHCHNTHDTEQMPKGNVAHLGIERAIKTTHVKQDK